MSIKLTPEEMEQHHIYDNDEIWERAQDSTSITFEDFAAMAQTLKDEYGRIYPDGGYLLTPAGAQVMLFKMFFDMGVWYGMQEYRRHIVAMMSCERDERGEPEIEEIPCDAYQLIDASVDAYAFVDEETAFAICSGWPLNIDDEDEDEDIE